LIGGQTTPTADTAAVDLFDPAVDSITAAEPMPGPRNGFTATVLSNGKVLVSGGTSTPGGTALATSEIYDPGANKWSAAASMAQPRAHHAAALMKTGKVFVVGGDGGSGMGDATSPEVYDPGTDTWTTVPNFNWGDRPRGPAVTVLSDGRVFVFGGFVSANLGDAVVQFYDPTTAQATYDNCLSNYELANATAAQLGSGAVMVAGGQQVYNPSGGLAQTILFDPTTGSCSRGNPYSTGPSMNVGHCHHTMTALSGDRILVAGGRCGPSESISVVELYDRAGNNWSLVAPLHEARGFHAAVLLTDGRLMVAGGLGTGGTILASIESYTPG